MVHDTSCPWVVEILDNRLWSLKAYSKENKVWKKKKKELEKLYQHSLIYFQDIFFYS